MRASDWTDGVLQPGGAWIFPSAPMTSDVIGWEHRTIHLADGAGSRMQCRAIYDTRPDGEGFVA